MPEDRLIGGGYGEEKDFHTGVWYSDTLWPRKMFLKVWLHPRNSGDFPPPPQYYLDSILKVLLS